jgi:hypothetical protein
MVYFFFFGALTGAAFLDAFFLDAILITPS